MVVAPLLPPRLFRPFGSRNLRLHHECIAVHLRLQAPPLLVGGPRTHAAARDCPSEEVRVAIVGAGYAGLNAALELHREGIDCIVLDANEPGFGGSSRNGGMVSGGVNVGKRYMAKAMEEDEAAPYLADAADAFSHVENLIAREKIDCGWTRAGYFLGAWCKSHYDGMVKKVDMLNRAARSEAYIVPPERQREEIGSDYYRGGMVVGRAGHLHPALFFKGLLDLCQARQHSDCLEDAGDETHAIRFRLAGRNPARHH